MFQEVQGCGYSPHSNNSPFIQSKDKKPLLLAVINPTSGQGKAVNLVKILGPFWNSLNIDYEVLITQHQGHCIEHLREHRNITSYAGIVAVGGDGTLLEVIEGLIQNKHVQNAVTKVPIGMVPGGSGNGMHASLFDFVKLPYSVENAARIIAGLETQPLDLIEMTQNNKTRTGTLAATTGFVADSDIKTESMRCLGDFRFTLGAIWSIWQNKAYQAKLSYLPIENEKALRSIPQLNESLSHKFRTLTGKFSLVYFGSPPFCSKKIRILPKAKINDGYLHGMVIREISRQKLIELLLSLELGLNIQDPCVFRFKTKFVRLEVESTDATLTFDGEKLPLEPIQCRILPSAINIFCSRPPLDLVKTQLLLKAYLTLIFKRAIQYQPISSAKSFKLIVFLALLIHPKAKNQV